MDDTELYTTLEIENEDVKELSIDDTDQQRYLDLELENEIEVIDTGKADVGEGTLTITQGGETKGTFNANSKTDVTIEVDAGGGQCEVTKAEFDAEVARAKAREDENTEAITEEVDRATAKEAEIEADVEAETARAKAREDEIEDMFDEYAPLASPALTGTPTAPTATAGTNTTQIATTAFVTDAINTAIVEVENGTY